MFIMPGTILDAGPIARKKSMIVYACYTSTLQEG